MKTMAARGLVNGRGPNRRFGRDLVFRSYFFSFFICALLLLLQVTAVVPAVGTKLAFWKSNGFYKIVETLELQCCKLKVLAHGVNHFLMFCTVGISIFFQQFV